MKRLYADIETLPNQVFAFATGFKKNINHGDIIKERCIICIGYKWEGEKTAKVLRFDKNQCDKAMLIKFIKIANEADEIVGHHGDKFDWPWIRTRALFHGLPPLPQWKTVDTRKMAARNYYFNSNKLDYISSFLGHGKKLKTDMDLWRDIALKNCKKSIDYMCAYCAIDVDRLEKVYHDLTKHCKPATHVGVLGGGEKWTSPFGGGTDVEIKQHTITALGTRQTKMKCQRTGRYYTISAKSLADYREWREDQKERGRLKQ